MTDFSTDSKESDTTLDTSVSPKLQLLLASVSTLLMIVIGLSLYLFWQLSEVQNKTQTTTDIQTETATKTQPESSQSRFVIPDYYQPWQTGYIPNSSISFQYPAEFILDTSATNLKIIWTGDNQTKHLNSTFFAVNKSTEPVTSLLDLTKTSGSLIEITVHQETFGKNVWSVAKGKYTDGPCSEKYLRRAVLAHQDGNIIVEDGCSATLGYLSNSFFEKFLASFQVIE